MPVKHSNFADGTSSASDSDNPSGTRRSSASAERRGAKPTTSSKKAKARITKDMIVTDILALNQCLEPVLATYGLGCFSCPAGSMETLEEGWLSHGYKEEELADLVTDLNEALENAPVRPQTLVITKEAAEGIQEIAKQEGKDGHGLRVMTDHTGAFFLEFSKSAERDEKTFVPNEGPKIEVYASAITLGRIGGSTIDFRDGRFKLDMEEEKTGGCGCGDGCGCK